MLFITHFFVFFSDFQHCINSKILSEMHRCHTQSLFPNLRNTPKLQTHTKRLTEISAQMKWTQHLDETGSLNEFKINDCSKTPDTSPVESKRKHTGLY